MTRDEALDILKTTVPFVSKTERQMQYQEAVRMAIDALKGGDAEMNETKSPYMQQTPSEDGDLISRDDAIEAKLEYRNEDMLDKEKSTYNKGWNDCNDAWVAIIKALPSAEAVQGWIPCSERLPNENEPVLVYGDLNLIIDSPQMDIARIEYGISIEERAKLGDCVRARMYDRADEHGNNEKPYCWKPFSPSLYNGQDVVAWMPLPTPYKGGDDE